MKYLIFDTETTGLPLNSKVPARVRPNNWPHIVSISWVVLESETNQLIKKQNFIVKPVDWTIPMESTNIHGIRHEHAARYGYDLEFVIRVFMNESYDALVAHNLEFDYNVLMNAILWDLKLSFGDIEKPRYCTMVLSKDLCKLPSPFYNGFKSPKLSELYEYAFHRKPVANLLHSSIYDALILSEIIQHCDALRSKMNLPSSHAHTIQNHEVPKEDPRTLRIRINDAEGNE